MLAMDNHYLTPLVVMFDFRKTFYCISYDVLMETLVSIKRLWHFNGLIISSISPFLLFYFFPLICQAVMNRDRESRRMLSSWALFLRMSFKSALVSLFLLFISITYFFPAHFITRLLMIWRYMPITPSNTFTGNCSDGGC